MKMAALTTRGPGGYAVGVEDLLKWVLLRLVR